MPRVVRVLAAQGDGPELPEAGESDFSEDDLVRVLTGIDRASTVLVETAEEHLEIYRRLPPGKVSITAVELLDAGKPIQIEAHVDRTFKVGVDPLVVKAVVAEQTGLRLEVESASAIELPSDYASAGALLRTAGLVALATKHKTPKAFIARLPGAFVMVTITSKIGVELRRLGIGCAEADREWVERSLRLDPEPDESVPWNQLVPCPEKPDSFRPPPKHDPARPYTTGSASKRIQALYALSRKPEAKGRLLALVADPANAGPAYASVRVELIDDLLRFGGEDVADLLFGLLRTETSDEVASKIAARAAKFPALLEQWCRDLAGAWAEDRRYATRILEAIEEDFAAVRPEWLGPLPPEVEQRLPAFVRARMKPKPLPGR